MKLSRWFYSGVLAIVLTLTTAMPSYAEIPSKDNFHIYVLLGQSNMAGGTEVEQQDKEPLVRTFLFNGNNQWEIAAGAINRYSNSQDPAKTPKLNSGNTFAKAIAQANPTIQIGLVSNARGATTIEQWSKSYNGSVTGNDIDGKQWTGAGTNLYTRSLERIREAQKYGTVKGILWHQGEGNRSDTDYLTKLAKLIDDLRQDLGEPNLPFIAGELYNGPGAYTTSAAFNARLAGLPDKVVNTGYISSVGTGVVDITTHFDAASQRLLGYRYADKVLQLVYGADIDTTVPSVPSDINVVATTASSVTLAWKPSTDNRGVMGYQIYVNGNQTATRNTTTTECTVTKLAPGSTVNISITAYDVAGNSSEWSNPVQVTLASNVSGTSTAGDGGTEHSSSTNLPLIHQQDFEFAKIGELPDGWEWMATPKSPDKPSVIQTLAQIGGTSGKQLLALTRTSKAANVTGQALFNFAPVRERLLVSFAVYTTSKQRGLRLTLGGSKNTPEIVHASSAQAAVYVVFGTSVMVLRDGAKNLWYNVDANTPGEWHRVTFDIDIQAQTVNLYVDDSSTPINTEPMSFNAPYSDLNTLAFSYQSVSSANNTDPAYIDDLVISGK